MVQSGELIEADIIVSATVEFKTTTRDTSYHVSSVSCSGLYRRVARMRWDSDSIRFIYSGRSGTALCQETSLLLLERIPRLVDAWINQQMLVISSSR